MKLKFQIQKFSLDPMNLILMGLLIFFNFNSCKDKESKELEIKKSNTSNGDISSISDGSEFLPTTLGEQLVNPYSLGNMDSAFKILTNSNCNLQPNFKYVRFLPSDEIQLNKLYEIDELKLYEYPLDRVITFYGDYYQDPNIPNIEDYTWLYTWVPYDYNFPAEIEYEVICDLFLPHNLQYIYSCEGFSIEEDDLELKAMELAGITDIEMLLAKKCCKPKRYFPSGTITVENTELGNVGLQNATVHSRNWFNLGTTQTNNNGQFYIDAGYLSRADVNITVEFENAHTKVRGIRGIRIWQIAYSVNQDLGDYSKSGLQNISFNIENHEEVSSEKQRRWVAAQTCNALNQYRQFSSNNNISNPNGRINIWISNVMASSSAPMLKKMGNTSFVNNIFLIYLAFSGHPEAAVILKIVQQYAPDVTIGYKKYTGNNLFSDELAFLLFHEFGHTSHYAKVGNSYWTTYIGNVIVNNGYGTSVNSTGGHRTSLSEGWAEYVGMICADVNYGGSFSLNQGFHSKSWIDHIELFKNTEDYPTKSGGFYFDLTDNSSEPSSTSITDEVNQYTTQQIFNALESGVTSLGDFKSKILSQNSSKQSTAVNNCFSSYGSM